MNLRTVGAWITAGAAFWVSLGSLDVTADGARVVRVAMLPGFAQLAACVALALAVGAALGARLTDGPRAVPGAAGAAPKRAASGDSFVPLYALSVLILPYLPWLPDWLPVLRVFAGPGRLLVWFVVASQVAWSVLGTGRGRRVVVRIRAWSAVGSYLVVLGDERRAVRGGGPDDGPVGHLPGRRRTALPGHHAEPASATTTCASTTTMPARTTPPTTRRSWSRTRSPRAGTAEPTRSIRSACRCWPHRRSRWADIRASWPS